MRFDRVGIRTRIAGGSLSIAILISVVAGIVINTQLERIVREGTVAVLDSEIVPYVVALETEPRETFDPPGPSQLIAVVRSDGRTPIDTLPAELAVRLPDLVQSDGPRTVVSGVGQYIVQSTEVDVAGETWHIIAARDSDAETTVLTQMRLLLVGGLILIAASVAVTAWALTAASLRPVHALRTTAETLIDPASTTLLPEGPADDEIARLARTLNDLIRRLRQSAARERQLVSDASHELRTPLAILRTQLELAVAESSSVEQLVTDIRGAERSAERLSTLVTSLLELSSIEAAGDAERSTGQELQRETEAAADRARFRTTALNVSISYDIDKQDGAGSASFPISGTDFGRAVENLINNSITALEADGSVTLQLDLRVSHLTLRIADTGGGMDPNFEQHAFDRFSRQDRSRTRRDGAGLGLAIVAAIIRNARGTIRLDNDPGIGLNVLIGIPALVEPEKTHPAAV